VRERLRAAAGEPVVRADGDWPAARQRVLRRMGELGLSVEGWPANGLATTTVRYFGPAPAHAGTLELSAGLGWPPGYLLAL